MFHGYKGQETNFFFVPSLLLLSPHKGVKYQTKE